MMTWYNNFFQDLELVMILVIYFMLDGFHFPSQRHTRWQNIFYLEETNWRRFLICMHLVNFLCRRGDTQQYMHLTINMNK